MRWKCKYWYYNCRCKPIDTVPKIRVLIDGYSGSVCSYYVHVTGDFIECRPPIVEDIVVDSKCSPLCPSISYKQTIKVVADPSLATISEVQYHWKITDPNGNVDAF